MLNELYLICSIIVMYPDRGTEEIFEVSPCKLMTIAQASKYLDKLGVNRHENLNVVFSFYQADVERYYVKKRKKQAKL